MEEDYKSSGLKIIWIGFQDRKDKITTFLHQHHVQSSLVYDTRDRISRQYSIKYGAGIVLIDKGGIVRKRVPKGVSEKVLKESIEYVLKAPPSKVVAPTNADRSNEKRDRIPG